MVRNERFEMRLDSDVLDKIDAWRAEQDDVPSRSEAARRLIESALSAAAFNPDRSQRLMIWMLSELLKTQPGYKNREDVTLIQEALYGGHFWALDWEMPGVMHDATDRPSDVSFVVDVLDMWDFIEDRSDKLSTAEQDQLEADVGPWARKPQFLGFDGNHEAGYRSIAKFLIENMGRFERFKGRTLNSHSPSVDEYRAMLDRFQPMRMNLTGRKLSVDELVQLLKRR